MRKLYFLFISFIFLTTWVIAGGPPGPPGNPPCWPPGSCVPIDNGIIFLLIAGMAYGGKKITGFFSNKKNA